MLESQQENVKTKLKTLDSKLNKAKEIWQNIEAIEANKEFLQDEEIENECKKTSDRIFQATQVEQEILNLQHDPAFLSKNQIYFLKQKVIWYSKIYN